MFRKSVGSKDEIALPATIQSSWQHLPEGIDPTAKIILFAPLSDE
jgi:hypothetical protein